MIQVSNNIKILVRPVELEDHSRLANLLHFETHVHRHLDWISPLDILEKQPFYVLEQDGKLEAALSCPIDPPDVAWLRLFVASSAISYEAAWQLLWREVRNKLVGEGGAVVVVIALHKWMADLLERNKFQRIQDVVFLKWENKLIENIQQSSISIRPMKKVDLLMVEKIDYASFKPIWRNSIDSLSAAYDQSFIATIAEDSNGLVAYQISTGGHMGGHLARLAVHPRAQGMGIGKAVVVDLLRQFNLLNVRRVTVNTQEDNIKSINLYERVGFKITGERYSVYQFTID